ncbi:MAG: hypothetical protein HFI29_05985 [Lachnospiraceae bacterium]|nr:hypothetical protein [Lachnospiraceae bacterium]
MEDKDIAERMQDISADLASCSAELQTIERELQNRIEFVENLKSEAEIAEDVVSLTSKCCASKAQSRIRCK